MIEPRPASLRAQGRSCDPYDPKLNCAGAPVSSRWSKDALSRTLSVLHYLTTGDFVEATFENWESEFLQMGMYVVLMAFLYQKGSSESKPIHEPAPQDEIRVR